MVDEAHLFWEDPMSIFGKDSTDSQPHTQPKAPLKVTKTDCSSRWNQRGVLSRQIGLVPTTQGTGRRVSVMGTRLRTEVGKHQVGRT